MNYLAIDPGANTGFAHGVAGKPPHSGVFKVPKVENEMDAVLAYRLVQVERLVMSLLKEFRIDRVYCEMPMMKTSGGMQADLLRYNYPGAIAMAALKSGVRCHLVPMQTWRKFAGVPTQAPRQLKGQEVRRKWMKQQGMDRCQQLGYPVKTNDEADAVLIWHAMHQKHAEETAQPDLLSQLSLT